MYSESLNTRFDEQNGIDFEYDDIALYHIGSGLYTGFKKPAPDIINTYLEKLILDGFNSSDYTFSVDGPIIPVYIDFIGTTIGDSSDDTDYSVEYRLVSGTMELVSFQGNLKNIKRKIPNSLLVDFYALYQDKIDRIKVEDLV